MNRSLRILCVAHSHEEVTLILKEFQRRGYEPVLNRVDSSAEITQNLSQKLWDLIIATDTIPHFSISAILKIWKNSGLDIPLILVSGHHSEEIADAAMKAGVRDCILMGNLTRLVPAAERELREVERRQYQKRVEETVRHMVYYDYLTDLPNRALLQEHIRKAINTARRDHQSVALLIIDISRFKEITDTLGHHYGDLLLKQMGPRVKDSLPKSAMVFRLGGDEFSVMLPNTHLEMATQTAMVILKAIEAPFLLEEIQLEVEVRMGIAVFPGHAEYADLLFRRADAAMYAAKKSDVSHLSYAPAMDETKPQSLALIRDLRRAIEQNELFLLFQPKINLKTGTVSGVEALIRWKHPEHDVISPDQFISLAERCGLIKPMTFWVVETALAQCHLNHQLGQKIGVSLNLSQCDLKAPQFIEQATRLLAAYDISAGYLKLEIAEAALMDAPPRMMDTLRRLKTTGIRLSIDDFGVGYSSLSYLKKLSVDEIKIDRSFIVSMDSDDLIIVRSAINLAHNLGLKVVAEGIESQAVLDQLAGLGCDEGQGDYISPPLPSDELPLWLIDTAPYQARSLWKTALRGGTV